MPNFSRPMISQPQRPSSAPVEHAGKWVAWDRGRSGIVAVGEEFASVRQQAIAAGHPLPLMEMVPRPRSFVG